LVVAQRYGGMNAEEHPLLQLPKDKQRDLANLVESDELNEVAEKTGYSRRQILGLLASLGAGAAVGGFSVNELVGVVEAAADTADSDGNVGLPGDRVDVYAEGIDASGEIGAGSVDTGSLNGGGPVSDGDGTERQIWVIANGASDPAGAAADDIIFEEES